MNDKARQALERIAFLSLERCVAKLSRISAGRWKVAEAAVSLRSMEEAIASAPSGAGAAVYFDVSGECPFASMVVFRPDDIEILSRGFLGFSFSKLPTLSQAHELLLSELGNIILNALVGSLSGALGRSFLPSVPKCVQGEPRFLLEALWTSMDRGSRHSLVAVTLDLECDGNVTRSEVLTVIPDAMEEALAGALQSGS